MKKRKFSLQIASVFLTILISMSVFISCTDENENNIYDSEEQNDDVTVVTDEYLIQKCVEDFLTAYNDGDMDRVLDCLDAKTRNAMEAMLNILGGLAGSQVGFDIDLKDFFSLGVNTTSGDFMLLDIINVEKQGNEKAVVTTSMSLPGGMDNEKVFFMMVYENGKWCINDITDKKGGISDDNQGNIDEDANITFNGVVYNHSTQTTYISFTKDNKEYSGILNSNGEIFYYVEGYIDYYWIDNESILVKEYVQIDSNHRKNVYDIVNSHGEIVATSKNGDFDAVIGYDDGSVLVYKNASTISEEKYCYGVIDSVTGNWKTPLTQGSELPLTEIDNDGSDWTSFEYCGDNIWISKNNSYYRKGIVIYNELENKVMFVNDAYYKYHTNSGLVIDGDYPYLYNSYIENPQIEGIILPSSCAINYDGSFNEVEAQDLDQVNDEIGISRVDDGDKEYFVIKNIKSNSSVVYREFASDQIYSYQIYDNFVLMLISGADGNKYCTAVNSSGEQQFEPIKIKSGSNNTPIYFQERIIYKKPNSDFYEMIDMQGNVLISSDREYKTIQTFDANGIAQAVNSDGESVAIGLDGKPINITLKD